MCFCTALALPRPFLPCPLAPVGWVLASLPLLFASLRNPSVCSPPCFFSDCFACTQGRCSLPACSEALFAVRLVVGCASSPVTLCLSARRWLWFLCPVGFASVPFAASGVADVFWSRSLFAPARCYPVSCTGLVVFPVPFHVSFARLLLRFLLLRYRSMSFAFPCSPSSFPGYGGSSSSCDW